MNDPTAQNRCVYCRKRRKHTHAQTTLKSCGGVFDGCVQRAPRCPLLLIIFSSRFLLDSKLRYDYCAMVRGVRLSLPNISAREWNDTHNIYTYILYTADDGTTERPVHRQRRRTRKSFSTCLYLFFVYMSTRAYHRLRTIAGPVQWGSSLSLRQRNHFTNFRSVNRMLSVCAGRFGAQRSILLQTLQQGNILKSARNRDHSNAHDRV